MESVRLRGKVIYQPSILHNGQKRIKEQDENYIGAGKLFESQRKQIHSTTFALVGLFDLVTA